MECAEGDSLNLNRPSMGCVEGGGVRLNTLSTTEVSIRFSTCHNKKKSNENQTTHVQDQV